MASNPLTDPNWATDVTEQITTLVGNVRDKTTNNAVKVVRGIVFGLLTRSDAIMLDGFFSLVGFAMAVVTIASVLIVGLYNLGTARNFLTNTIESSSRAGVPMGMCAV